MATRIEWTEKSKSNLNHIFSYIATDSKIYASRFVTDLIETTEKQLLVFPNSGRLVPEFVQSQLNYLREVIFKGYRIIYNPTNLPEKIIIIAVVSGRMNLVKQID